MVELSPDARLEAGADHRVAGGDQLIGAIADRERNGALLATAASRSSTRSWPRRETGACRRWTLWPTCL